MDPKVTGATTVVLLLALTAITIFQMREIRRLRLANSNLAKEIQTLPTRKSQIGHAQATPESLPPSPAIKRPSWRDVESTDYHRFIENMRTLEMPEETIRDIVLADVNKLYEQRKREVLKGTVRDEFWKPQGRGRVVDSERSNTLHAMGKEKEQVIKELLSIEVPQPEFATSPEDLESQMDWQWSFLPGQKRAELTELIRKLRPELRRNASEDETKAWDEKYHARIAETLSQEEWDEYQLRGSGLSFRLVEALRDFQPSEEEFRTLFSLMKENGGNLARRYSKTEWENVKVEDPQIFAKDSVQDQFEKSFGSVRSSELRQKARFSKQ